MEMINFYIFYLNQWLKKGILLQAIFILLSLIIPFSCCFAVYPPPVVGKHGMVVSVQQLASKAGVDILKKGGNAVDAAVAVGYALAVVYPYAGNLGGGGFMLIRTAEGKNIFLNFRGKAPLAATKDMFLDKKGNIIPKRSLLGYQAITVPGTVMGLNYALTHYGTLPLNEVMKPAIELAEKGYQLSAVDAAILRFGVKDFRKQSNVAAIFLKNNQQPYQTGDQLIQKNLAHSLKLIANQGTNAFYTGPIADQIIQASKSNGGLLTKKDFADYTIEVSNPVECNYRGYQVISAAPPSSGGTTLCEILNIAEAYPLSRMGFHSSQAIHFLVEAMRYAYFDRNNRLGDPDFVKNPVQQLTSKLYAAKIRTKIHPIMATPSTLLKGQPQHESQNTTHYSVVDAKGNAVSVTYTLNNSYGARVIAGNTGFFLNDDMDDFTLKLGAPNSFKLIQGPLNSIAPGKRPLSSMAPTIVTHKGKTVMVLGSPAGPAIITAILQTIINVVDYKMDIKTAVDMPRFHFQWVPDLILKENYSFSRDTEEQLSKMGYHFTQTINPLGVVEAIVVDPVNHIYYGASDDRIPSGKAMGF